MYQIFFEFADEWTWFASFHQAAIDEAYAAYRELVKRNGRQVVRMFCWDRYTDKTNILEAGLSV